MPNIPYVFFGSPDFAVTVLTVLAESGLPPTLVVTSPDRGKGRGQSVSPSPVGTWAAEHGIETLKPAEINKEFTSKLRERAPEGGWPTFLVVAYGQILPAELIYLPTRNTLNLHPSLLPRGRGAAPIRDAILKENETGVSIIELDEKMDHGPLVAQEKFNTKNWPPRYDELAPALATAGAALLADTLPDWAAGRIETTAQNHDRATYSQKFQSSDGEIDLNSDSELNFRKIQAFTDWPRAHFFADGERVLITKAHRVDGELIIDRVKPAGDEEMTWKAYQQSNQG